LIPHPGRKNHHNRRTAARLCGRYSAPESTHSNPRHQVSRLGVEDPIAAVADRYELDRGALEAAARSALAVPDRVVGLDVLAPAA